MVRPEPDGGSPEAAGQGKEDAMNGLDSEFGGSVAMAEPESPNR